MLTVLEGEVDIPFPIQRIFSVYRVQPPYERGGHAHPDTELLLMCVSGQMKVDVSDPSATQTFELNDPSYGLYVPEMIWTRLYAFTPDAVCVAAASTHYENSDVIRDWHEYLRAAGSSRGGETPSPSPSPRGRGDS
jgi:hypothetical protein